MSKTKEKKKSKHKKQRFVHPDLEISWAAGLFAGEGHARCVWRGVNKDRGYPEISVTMLDQACIARFANVWGFNTYTCRYRDGVSWRVSSAGLRAGEALNDMIPFLDRTDKLNQVLKALHDAEWKKVGGLYVPPVGRRSAAMMGNQNSRKAS